MVRSSPMPGSVRVAALVAAAAILTAHHAFAHAVAGARIFVNTDLIDDPGVSDEANLPLISLQSPDGKSWVTDANVEYDKTITPHLGFGIGTDYDWITNDSERLKEEPWRVRRCLRTVEIQLDHPAAARIHKFGGGHAKLRQGRHRRNRIRLRHHHALRLLRQRSRRHSLGADPSLRCHRRTRLQHPQHGSLRRWRHHHLVRRTDAAGPRSPICSRR